MPAALRGAMTATRSPPLPSALHVRVLPLAVTAALLLGACLWSWRGELAGSWQLLRIREAEERGVCAAAVASRAAAAEAAAVKAGAPPLKQVEAQVVEQQCSDDYRAAAYRNATQSLSG